MREAGVSYARLSAVPRSGAPYPLDADDRYALIRLGPDRFLRWALAGWRSHHMGGEP